MAMEIADGFLSSCEPKSVRLATERIEAKLSNEDFVNGRDPDEERSEISEGFRARRIDQAIAEGTPAATADDKSFAIHAPIPEVCVEEIIDVLDQTGASAAVIARIDSTRALDGQQTADTDGWRLTCSYHPDAGLALIGEQL